MKKIILSLLIAIGFLSAAQAQESGMQLIADFNDGFPDNFTMLDLDGLTPYPGQPAQNATWDRFTLDGIDFFALSSSWFNPAGQADDWMIIQDLEIADVANKVVLTFEGQSMDPSYLETLELLVDEGNSVEPGEFELIETINQVNGADFREYAVDLTDYVGQTISFAFRNVSYDKYYLLVDNIKLWTVGEAVSADVAGKVTSPYFVENESSAFVTLSVTNTGYEDITSVTLNATSGENSEEIVKDGIRIKTLNERSFSVEVPESLASAPGNTISFQVTAINDEAVEMDEFEVGFSILPEEAAQPKLALSEMFTASSCPPCEPGNRQFMGIVDNITDQEVHYIKLQQDFPNGGDPYTTAELVERRNVYGISAVPELRVDGTVLSENPNSLSATVFKNAIDNPGFVTFDDVKYEVDEKTVSVSGTYTVLSKVLENTKLMAAIVEDTTYKNIGGNGQTHFLHVVKKFMGGLDGLTIGDDTPLNEPQEFEFSYTFQGDYRLPPNGQPGSIINHDVEHTVEDFDALSVSVWVENQDHHFILNSAMGADRSTSTYTANKAVNEIKIYPQPVSDFVQIDINVDKMLDAEVSLINMNGQKVKALHHGTLYDGVNKISADVTDLAPGRYMVEMRGKNLYHGVPLLIVR